MAAELRLVSHCDTPEEKTSTEAHSFLYVYHAHLPRKVERTIECALADRESWPPHVRMFVTKTNMDLTTVRKLDYFEDNPDRIRVTAYNRRPIWVNIPLSTKAQVVDQGSFARGQRKQLRQMGFTKAMIEKLFAAAQIKHAVEAASYVVALSHIGNPNDELRGILSYAVIGALTRIDTDAEPLFIRCRFRKAGIILPTMDVKKLKYILRGMLVALESTNDWSNLDSSADRYVETVFHTANVTAQGTKNER